MKKTLDRPSTEIGKGPAFGRARFARISAVEGIHLTPEMEERFRDFDRHDLPSSERRKAIARVFRKGL